MEDVARIPLIAEEIDVVKHVYATGKVRVSTKVETEELIARETLERSTADVRRVPKNVEVDDEPQVREENGVLIVPVVEERLVIEKRMFLVEELHITREQTSLPVEVPVTRRVMRAIVERDDMPNKTSTQQRGPNGEL